MCRTDTWSSRCRCRVSRVQVVPVQGEEVADRVLGHRLEDDWRLGLPWDGRQVLLVNVVGELQSTRAHNRGCSGVLLRTTVPGLVIVLGFVSRVIGAVLFKKKREK